VPKFYFNLRDDQCLISDEEGLELPDAAAARMEAEEGGREIVAEAIKDHKLIDDRKIEVVSEGGEILETVRLRDLLV
jgi:hypothetical protein